MYALKLRFLNCTKLDFYRVTQDNPDKNMNTEAFSVACLHWDVLTLFICNAQNCYI